MSPRAVSDLDVRTELLDAIGSIDATSGACQCRAQAWRDESILLLKGLNCRAWVGQKWRKGTTSHFILISMRTVSSRKSGTY